ncbi:MAE_28990/MAE_18760 family HEPN-like nuclease [Dehalobacter sp. TeCB1]|uniref:MAE_28990/MAE_18760 family HEPN-like nuclease n=1 Tax=Dehalobacter sp. TeCB1 TaxID=1843715 RepID=UPI00083A48DA|nr:MAE_28990/MAE_18760 family HEPN-like nuclease [Dehalobacter sp. TeCB1]OCZ49910.1 hypothetical protein A7D23_00760 [Dehalobacter sp. TeCB1]
MQNTLGIYADRKEEINFYFSIMVDLDKNSQNIKTINNNKFYKIIKSNFLLMLYNLVEACIVSGMMEIYENLKNDDCSYNSVIKEIQLLWSNYKINEIYGPATGRSAYENRVQQIIDSIIKNSPLILTKDSLGINGNLDARKIKYICDKHKIRYTLKNDGASLEIVKKRRNDLAHGDVSFSECARDLPIDDLEKIMDEVLIFSDDILQGMKRYYDGKMYRISQPS